MTIKTSSTRSQAGRDGNNRTTAASIKKFYKYLLKIGVVQSDNYDSLLEIIKEEMPEWLEEMRDYDAAVFDW